MAIQSLMLISLYHLDVKVIVLNNEALGMITQFQHLYFNDRMAGTISGGGYNVPDIECLARAYGLSYVKIMGDSWNIEYLKSCMDMPLILIDYKIEGMTVVYPKLEYNKPIEKQTPLLGDDEFDDIMDVLFYDNRFGE